MARNNAKIPGRASSDTCLSSTDFRVLIAICRCVDMKTNGNHIKRETLSALSGEKVLRNITRSTCRLVKFGYIQKTGNGGRSRPAYYRVFMDGERVSTDTTVSSPERVSNSAPKGCQNAAQTVSTDTTGIDRDINTEKKTGKTPPINGTEDQNQSSFLTAAELAKKVAAECQAAMATKDEKRRLADKRRRSARG